MHSLVVTGHRGGSAALALGDDPSFLADSGNNTAQERERFGRMIGHSVVMQRVFETLDTRPEIVDAPDAIYLPTVRGEVEFQNVTFGYDSDQPVLHDVSFQVHPGEIIAIVGPSGAGKSTVVNLLARFYDVNEGCVLVDGKDVRTVRLESMRRHIGMVAQETILFSGTIYDNLALANPHATFEQVIQACKLAEIHDTIEQLPEGYRSR